MNKIALKQLNKPFITREEMGRILKLALSKDGLLKEEDTAVIFYDTAYLEERIRHVRQLFPGKTLHAVAAKANPLVKILKRIQKTGAGLEVASLPELFLAIKSGFAPGKIVFDSPCKTIKEIEYALKLGVYINADSFDELDRIGEILKTRKTKSIIAVRVNPQVGAGAIQSTSVADAVSKFGIPMNGNLEKLEACFLKYEWLQGIHVHIGSQGCQIPLIIKGIRKVLDFSISINKKLEKTASGNRIGYFDLGGGLPVSYHEDKSAVSMETYVDMLKKNAPELFSGRFTLITEFGRYLHANTGWVASKVEYVKKEKNSRIIMIHVGADLLLRKCYNPADWHHRISVADNKGKIKTSLAEPNCLVAGPLCFAGDIIAKNIKLPDVKAGDYIFIHDTGAYTLSMWSRYNSRQIPLVLGYGNVKKGFEIIKKREQKEKLLDFWS